MNTTCHECKTIYPDDKWEYCSACEIDLCLPCANVREFMCKKCFEEELTAEELNHWYKEQADG